MAAIMTQEKLALLLQHIAPQHALSWIAGVLAESRWPWLKNYLIEYFINRYDVDVNTALSSNLADYPTFNSFFTRQLKPELRPITQQVNEIASPVDGSISQIGQIKDDALFQAKGFDFDLCSLLGGSTSRALPFQRGHFATLYLAPKDYHRIHMPFPGMLRETVYIPGKLFSVNQRTVRTVPNLFARNERLVCIFESSIGPIAVILVGAMLVGSIQTVWNTPPSANKIVTQTYPLSNTENLFLDKGAELGHFKMGSTVIMLLPKDRLIWSPQLQENTIIQMGQSLGKID
jgi:phosphatidylserine decarboxylase